MNKKRMIIAVVFIVVTFTAVVYAAGGAGSEDDPLVTKSYVDSVSSFVVVEMSQGQTLIGGEGTEIILRSGEATAIDNGSNGVSDLTDGKELWSGTGIGTNHLLLVPREDGRGIRATTDVYVMVKGTYTLQ